MRTEVVLGYVVEINDAMGHLAVAHDGAISWDELQAIKAKVWGDEARAIELYPALSAVVNNGNWRHLWRLGPTDFAPDLLGETGREDSLEARYERAFMEARAVFSEGGT